MKKIYEKENTNLIAFPMGGMGAGMMSLSGQGGLTQVSLRHKPDVFHDPRVFSALCILGDENQPLVLESPVPRHKVFGLPHSGMGSIGGSSGFPRFESSTFQPRFPFAHVGLERADVPLQVTLCGWSPFIPNDADNSSLPAAALEYTFTNRSDQNVEAVYSFHARNIMVEEAWAGSPKEKRQGVKKVEALPQGFVTSQGPTEAEPWRKGAFSAQILNEDITVCPWFRGQWFDSVSYLWKTIKKGLPSETKITEEGPAHPGASIYTAFTLQPGEKKTIRVLLSWYAPESNLRTGEDSETPDESCVPCDFYYKPWYAGRFQSIHELNAYWAEQYDSLRERSLRFSDALQNTSLDPAVVDAVSANLSILKSPTVLRQSDGRLWAWEGCHDEQGSCPGTCTHVWNYAQAIAHLFPDLERGLRETELFEAQNHEGVQTFRVPLPIRSGEKPPYNTPAADGQLGGIMKVHREWKISGDTNWLKKVWPATTRSLDFCIAHWDPDQEGVLRKRHHNTYDIDFFSPNGMCSSIYIGALKAAVVMGEALNENTERYRELYEKGRIYLEEKLFNGEFFIQEEKWDPEEIRADESYESRYPSPETLELLEKEAPKYQYGTGCLSDGVIGAWFAQVCALGDILDPEKVKSHLKAVHKYNFKQDLSAHANPQRPSFAIGKEGGLLLCTWPNGGEYTLPFVYSHEVWTGIEYQVASHLMIMGCTQEALDIVRACRSRYDGATRNPFDEYECGHWYARALASYALLQGLSGIRYDALEKTLYIKPRLQGDFTSFLSTATGYGLAGIRDGEPFVDVVEGKIKINEIATGESS